MKTFTPNHPIERQDPLPCRQRIFTVTISFIIALLAGLFSMVAHAAPGDLDLSFEPGSGIDGEVNALAVQPDGKLIIGGTFTTVNGLKRNSIARLNADGSGDASFDAGTVLESPTLPNDTYAYCVALQPDGKVVAGGNFQTPNGPAHIVRLNADGSLDNTFNQGVPIGDVNSIVLQSDGKLLIGGATFDAILGVTIGTLLRLNADGSLDGSFNASPDRRVAAIALQSDGKILIGGSFGEINGVIRNGIARLHANGSLDISFDPGPGTPDPDLGEAFRDVQALALQADGTVLIGGVFSPVAEDTAQISVARLNPNGSLDATFHSDVFTVIESILPQANGKIIIGGAVTPGGSYYPRIARFHADGTLDETFRSTATDDGIISLAAQADGKLMIWGRFDKVNDVLRTRIARLNADGTVDSSFDPGGIISASYAPRISSVVAQPDGKVLVGGTFSDRKGRDLIRLNSDGSDDESFNPEVWGVSQIVLQPDGKILIAGNGVIRLNSDGTRDTAFVFAPSPEPPDLSVEWVSLALQADGKVIVGGYTVYWEGPPYSRCIRLNPNGSLDPSFSTADRWNDFGVFGLAVQADGKILHRSGYPPGGYSGGISRLNSDGSTDASFDAFGPASSMTVQPDGKILVGGDGFGVKRLMSTGVIDSSFSQNTVELASSPRFVRQTDGKVLIGGSLKIANGALRTQIARLNANGTLDTSFAVAAPAGPFSTSVHSIAVQPDGNIIIGGSFTTVNDVLRPYVARLYGDSQPPPPNTPPAVTIIGASPLIVEAAANYTDPGATAFDAMDGTLSPFISSNSVVPNLPGNYAVTWAATDSLGATGFATRTVTVQDTTAPSIGGAFSPLRLKARSALPDFRPQAVVSDIVGVTSVTQSPPPGTRVVGPTMNVTITARDAANNAASLSFTVKVTGR